MEVISAVCGRRLKRQRISAERLKARFVEIHAKDDNRGPVFIGDATVSTYDPGLEPGRTLGIRGYPFVDLYDLFVVAQRPGSGIEVVAW